MVSLLGDLSMCAALSFLAPSPILGLSPSETVAYAGTLFGGAGLALAIVSTFMRKALFDTKA